MLGGQNQSPERDIEVFNDCGPQPRDEILKRGDFQATKSPTLSLGAYRKPALNVNARNAATEMMSLAGESPLISDYGLWDN